MTKDRLKGEFDLIRKYFAPLADGNSGALGLVDDAAVLSVPDGYAVVSTTDTILSGVHFLEDTPPEAIAKKLIRVNLSDLAAMGATPWTYSLAVSLTRDIDASWLEEFSEALAGDQETYGISLIGGDTVVTPGPLTLTVTALGLVRRGREIKRSGAAEGDDVYVSGTIGDGALGLLAAKGTLDLDNSSHAEYLANRYRYPVPRVRLGAGLTGLAHGAADISDGLVADLGHICRASGVSANIYTKLIPVSAAAAAVLKASPHVLPALLTGGDDYELVFTGPKPKASEIARVAAETGTKVTIIGEIESDGPDTVRGGVVRVYDENRVLLALENPGYRHL